MKKAKIIIPITLLVALMGIVLYYTRPMTLSQICFGVDMDQCESVSGYYFIAPGVDDSPFEIDQDDEKLSQILELFDTRKFSKSLVNLLPRGNKTHQLQEGDFKWEILFEFSDVTYPDGSTNSGTLIRVSNFFGVIEVHFNGDVWRCSTSDKEEWLSNVMSLISNSQ